MTEPINSNMFSITCIIYLIENESQGSWWSYPYATEKSARQDGFMARFDYRHSLFVWRVHRSLIWHLGICGEDSAWLAIGISSCRGTIVVWYNVSTLKVFLNELMPGFSFLSWLPGSLASLRSRQKPKRRLVSWIRRATWSLYLVLRTHRSR